MLRFQFCRPESKVQHAAMPLVAERNGRPITRAETETNPAAQSLAVISHVLEQAYVKQREHQTGSGRDIAGALSMMDDVGDATLERWGRVAKQWGKCKAGPSESQQRRGGGGGGSTTTCNHCHRPGHKSTHCWDLHPELNRSKGSKSKANKA